MYPAIERSEMTTNAWDDILTRAETKVNRHSFYTWFKPTTFVCEADNELTVRVPNGLFRDWLTKHYAAVISEAVTEIQRDGIQITFVTAGEASAAEPLPTEPKAPSNEAPRPGARPGGLNPRYAFDTFVVGSSNQFAHAASLAVAEAPSRAYNPLFIYGGVGLGKTHLMHAIGQYLLNQTPDIKLTYISSERFMNEMITCGSLRQDSHVSRALSNDRRPARRRYTVPRWQGRHTDRVLPHLQFALRRHRSKSS